MAHPQWVRVDYLGTQPLLVTGASSRLRYTFRPGQPATIAADDLEQFLQPADGTLPFIAKRE